MNIAFIGTGYVGLVSGIMMGYLGHDVICLDKDKSKIDMLRSGTIPIYEPELTRYMKKSLDNNKLKFIDNYDESLSTADAIFISVGTPPTHSGDANLDYVNMAVDEVMKFAKPNCVVVIKSTVPPGTCSKIAEKFSRHHHKLYIASNPEFLREGSAVFDFLNPDRIVIGTLDKHSYLVMKEIYQPLIDRSIQIVNTDIVTSELIKYASNSFLATKVAFINEMANLCEKIGADINKLALGMGSDLRIGTRHLKAGPGFGGSCFPKDILALAHLCEKNNSRSLILDSVIEANKKRPSDMVKNIESLLGRSLESSKLALLGLTFKNNTDDVRCSPAIQIAELLINKGANVQAYDPEGMENAAYIIKGLKYADRAEHACIDVDAIVIATEWSEFKEMDFAYILTKVKAPIIFDLRNMLDAGKMQKLGFKYYTIGKKHKK